MQKYYKQYQASLGDKVNTLPITDDHIDFEKSHTTCRDIPCAITFAIFLVIGFVILIYSVAAGKPGLLYKPVDNFGGVCGYDFNSVNNKGKKFFDMDAGECVSSCPSGTKATMSYCVDETVTNELQNLKSDILGDIVSRIWVATLAFVITAGFCLVYVVLLIFLAYYIVWGSIFVSIAGIGILTVVFFILAVVMFSRGDEVSKPLGVVFIIFAIVFLIVFIVVTCVVYFLRSRINLCIALVQEACRGIKALPWLALVPIASTVLTGLVYFLFCLTLIFFIGSFKVTILSFGGGFGLRTVDINGFQYFVVILDVFIVLWVSFLCIGLAQSVIAGGLATWYFARDKENLTQPWPVCGAFYRTFRYSFGTICAGSGIIALIETLKILCSYDKDKKKGSGGCLACLCCCLMCLLICLERFIVFISARAYIIASITGNGFIQTCKDAFFLLLRNILTTIVLENVKTIPTTLGKIFIFVISAFLTLIICNPYVFSSGNSNSGYVVTYWFLVYIICIIIILFVLQTMTTIIDYSVDSIFIFFLYDEEFAQSTNNAPYASPDLAKHMNLVTDKGREMAQKEELSIPVTEPKENTPYPVVPSQQPPYSYPSPYQVVPEGDPNRDPRTGPPPSGEEPNQAQHAYPPPPGGSPDESSYVDPPSTGTGTAVQQELECEVEGEEI